MIWVAIILQGGGGTILAKLDRMHIALSQCTPMTITFMACSYVDMPFGFRSAPKNCMALADGLITHHKAALHNLGLSKKHIELS